MGNLSKDFTSAHKSLTNASNEFNAIIQKIEERFKELEEKEEELKKKEDDIQKRSLALDAREQEVREKEQKINEGQLWGNTSNNSSELEISFEEKNVPELNLCSSFSTEYSISSNPGSTTTTPRVLGLPDPIQEWFPDRTFSLLYKASRDGFRGEDFHKICDFKGPTISIIESDNNFLFGGYSPISWGEENTKKQKRDSINSDFFLFTITNPHNIPPTQYFLKDPNDKFAIHNEFNVAFGRGPTLSVALRDAQMRNNSFSCFGYRDSSYVDTTGKGNSTFTGAYSFRVKEIEVYLVA